MLVVRNVRARWLVLGLAAAIVIVLAALAWVGVRAILAKKELDAVTPRIGELRQSVGDQDLDALTAIAHEVAPHIAEADSLTSDPVWRATEILPVLGPNLAAARVASAQLNVLVNQLALPLAEELPALSDGDGDIDVSALQSVASTLSEVDAALQAGQRDLDGLHLNSVLPAVADGVHQLQEATVQVAPVVHDLAPFTRIAPDLLGADAPRHVLVIVQNNAELRTGGGISGSFVELVADKGKISLGDVASDAEFPQRDKPVAKIPESTSKLYGNIIGTHVQNTTVPADFTVTAELARAWWRVHAGDVPDAVMSIDPVVLASLLQATGPVTVKGVTLTADNAVQELLVGAYLNLPEEKQDPFFEAAAIAVFQKLTDGSADMLTLVRALQEPLTDGHLSLWSAEPGEQKVLADGTLGGPAARHAAAGRDAYAIYLNDATGSKMDSFLQTSISVDSAQCRTDGHGDVAVRVALKNTAPEDAATALPGNMTGWGLNGTPAGDIRTIVSVAAPSGTFFGGVSMNGKAVASPDVVDAGSPTSAASVVLKPGQRKTIEFRFTAAHSGDVRPVILHTPMMHAPDVSTGVLDCG
jgi:hypothetical protein